MRTRWSFAHSTCLALLAATGPAAAASRDFALVVVPARYSVIQVAMDIIGKRPAVLLSYRGEAATQDPLLHAWNGEEWVRVTLKDYREASFVKEVPRTVVLVGDQQTLPTVIREASAWCPRVVTVSDLTTGSMVNEFGRIFKWRKAEWEWFAKRYNLSLVDESEPYRRSSWYDRPGPLPREGGKGLPGGDATIAPPVHIEPAPAVAAPKDDAGSHEVP
jgi:hypothetical protein